MENNPAGIPQGNFVIQSLEKVWVLYISIKYTLLTLCPNFKENKESK